MLAKSKAISSKLAFVAIACIAAICCVLALTGCQPKSDEEVIRDAITTEFDAYKNADDTIISGITAQAEQQGLDKMGIKGQEFASAILDGFDYNIDNIVIDGDNAEATLTIVSKSFSEYQEKVVNVINDYNANVDPSATQEERLSGLGARVMEVFDGLSIVTEQVTIDYEKIDNQWEPLNSNEVLSNLNSIVFAQGDTAKRKAD